MTILLFGGSSRLGTAMRRLWTSHAIVAPSRTDVDILNADVLNAYVGQMKPDWIINCIAYNNVDGGEGTEKDLALQINGVIPGLLATAAAKKNVPFIHVSTDYVFDGAKSDGYVESDTPNPINVYGSSKLQGEAAAQKAHPTGTCIVRTSRLYGAGAESVNAKKNFIELIVADAQKAARILVNSGENASPTFVDDLARHIDEHIIASRPEPGVYHMSNSGSATWFEWATEIGRILKLPTTFAPRDPSSLRRPAARPACSVLLSTTCPTMRPWQEALREFIQSQTWNFQPTWNQIGIEGAAVEFKPRLGDDSGAVLHMIPGGTKNAEGFGNEILDIYASTAKGKNKTRGGHYHVKLDELFFTVAGCALWILSDFREGSPTKGKTVGLILGAEKPTDTHGLPCHLISDGSLVRLRVPAGVYHSYIALTDERVSVISIGSTPYDKEDYHYPTVQEVPGMADMLADFGIEIPSV